MKSFVELVMHFAILNVSLMNCRTIFCNKTKYPQLCTLGHNLNLSNFCWSFYYRLKSFFSSSNVDKKFIFNLLNKPFFSKILWCSFLNDISLLTFSVECWLLRQENKSDIDRVIAGIKSCIMSQVVAHMYTRKPASFNNWMESQHLWPMGFPLALTFIISEQDKASPPNLWKKNIRIDGRVRSKGRKR